MREYNKIPNLYERDAETGKIRNIYSSVELATLRNISWIVTEKIDGMNIRVIWDGHKVSFKGRTEKSIIPKEMQARLEELFGGEDKEELFEQQFGEKEVILFGEGYGGKIQRGSRYSKTEDFVLFDVLINDIWLNYCDIHKIASNLGIKCVPFWDMINLEEATQIIKEHPTSRLAEDKTLVIEGFVCKPYCGFLKRNGGRLICKIKCRDFPLE